jgi:Cu+-exporting ATPase
LAEKKITLPVTGMTCTNCAMNIERAVKKVPGVREAHVNFASEQAAISYDSNSVQVQNLVEKIQDAGFGVARSSIEITGRGMK